MSAATTHKFGALFAKQAHFYAAHRPTYPAQLYDAIYAYKQRHGTPTFDLAADIACGSGQAARDVAKRFAHVIGIDASAEQVAQAPPAANIEFKQGTSEDSHLESSSLDLITCAQAMHWFDIKKFYKEANRILKPNGTLAVWSYPAGAPMHAELNVAGRDEGLEVNKAARDAFMAVYTTYMIPHFAMQVRTMVDNKYLGLEPTPSDGFVHCERWDSYMDKVMPLAGLTHYMWSWSAHVTYLEKNSIERGSAEDIIVKLQRRLVDIFAPNAVPKEAGDLDERVLKAAEETLVCMRWPVGVLLATKAA